MRLTLICNVAFAVAWLLLAGTAAAKAFTLISMAQVMGAEDPVLGLRLGTLLILATGLEVVVCGVLLVLRDAFLRGLVLAGLGVQFLTYHAVKLMIAPHGLCPCLGTAWKWLHLTEAGATRLALGIALAITAAGVLLLFHHGRCVEAA